MFNNIFPKIVSFMSNVKKYGTAGQSTDYNILRRMRIMCWIDKATNMNSEYAIFIAFPLHQYLHERASVLRFTYIAWFLMFLVISQRGIHISFFFSWRDSPLVSLGFLIHEVCVSRSYTTTRHTFTHRPCLKAIFKKYSTISVVIYANFAQYCWLTGNFVSV